MVRFGVYFEGRTNRTVEESNTGCEIKKGRVGRGGYGCFVPVVSRNASDLLWSRHFMGDGARQNLKGQLGDGLVLELGWLTIYNPLRL